MEVFCLYAKGFGHGVSVLAYICFIIAANGHGSYL